jgi:hypothetical protein
MLLSNAVRAILRAATEKGGISEIKANISLFCFKLVTLTLSGKVRLLRQLANNNSTSNVDFIALTQWLDETMCSFPVPPLIIIH